MEVQQILVIIISPSTRVPLRLIAFLLRLLLLLLLSTSLRCRSSILLLLLIAIAAINLHLPHCHLLSGFYFLPHELTVPSSSVIIVCAVLIPYLPSIHSVSSLQLTTVSKDYGPEPMNRSKGVSKLSQPSRPITDVKGEQLDAVDGMEMPSHQQD